MATKRFTDTDGELMRVMRQSGMTLKRLALEFDTTEHTVRRYTDPKAREHDRAASKRWKERNKQAIAAANDRQKHRGSREVETMPFYKLVEY
jgi:hypothetical protein